MFSFLKQLWRAPSSSSSTESATPANSDGGRANKIQRVGIRGDSKLLDITNNLTGNKLSKAESVLVELQGFQHAELTTGTHISSEDFELHGRTWLLRIYPGGENVSCKDYMSVFLYIRSPLADFERVCARYACCIPSFAHPRMPAIKHTFRSNDKENNRGWMKFGIVKRDKIIRNALNNDGKLSIKLTMQVDESQNFDSWAPRQTLSHDMLTLFESQKFTDVIFNVQGQQLRAHRAILLARNPSFAALLDGDLENEEGEVMIQNEDPDAFRLMLQFIYADDDKIIAVTSEPKQLLCVANKYGCWRLKLLLENVLVKKHLDLETAVDLLLFADGQCCSILKEACLNLIALNLSKMMETKDWFKVEESSTLLSEIIRTDKCKYSDSKNDVYTRLAIAELYRKLEQLGELDGDGTRSMLLKRLREATEKESVFEGGGSEEEEEADAESEDGSAASESQ